MKENTMHYWFGVVVAGLAVGTACDMLLKIICSELSDRDEDI